VTSFRRGARLSGVLVRREEPGDVETVRSVIALAFARPDAPGEVPVEVRLLDELRIDESWLPALSLVAAEPPDGKVTEQKIIGQVVCTRGTVDGRPALGLAPLAVHPDRQGRGVGSALMHAVLGAADALDEPLVALLGEPDYYARYGFRPSVEYGITAPDTRWGNYFQVRVLSAYRPLKGTFAYAKPFDRI
jgi:putative acetyltransferase